MDQEPLSIRTYKPDEFVLEYLEGVVGLVEATTYESQKLWEENQERDIQRVWVSERGGYLPTVATIGGHPITISIFVKTIDGHRLLFWHPTSQLVYHPAIEEWFKAHCPQAFRDDLIHLNATDANNFHNVFPRKVNV